MTEHKQEASPRVAAMRASRRGCLLPRELPKANELPEKESNTELPKEGNNEGDINFLPLNSQYTTASCKLKKKIKKMVSNEQ